jgi:hypothetical protein
VGQGRGEGVLPAVEGADEVPRAGRVDVAPLPAELEELLVDPVFAMPFGDVGGSVEDEVGTGTEDPQGRAVDDPVRPPVVAGDGDQHGHGEPATTVYCSLCPPGPEVPPPGERDTPRDTHGERRQGDEEVVELDHPVTIGLPPPSGPGISRGRR